jgi:anti-sigma factor RsiW
MKDQWADRLSEYLDGELEAPERHTLEEHLAGCEACRATLEELRGVVARAGSLEDRSPAADLWPGIADRIGAAGAERKAEARWRALRLTLTVPQLAAAAVALMAVSAGGVWLANSRQAPTPTVAARPAAGAGLRGVAPVSLAEGPYESAVRDLQRVLDEGRGRLDTATVRVLEQNLHLIDAAIAECRQALAADPASAYLNAHLADIMQQKLELLRQAARLAAART